MKKIMKTLLILIAVALIVIVAIRTLQERRARNAQTPPATIYPVVVNAFVPKVSNVTLTLPYLALSMNESDVKVSSRIAARIEKIKKSGTHVEKGEVVATLDTTDLLAKIRAKKVALLNMERSHKRTEDLFKVKGASIEQLQKEQSAIAGMKAELDVLKNQLGYATLTSPVTGTVSKAFAAEGDMAMPGKPLLQVSANSNFSLLVRVPQDLKPKAVLFEGKRYALYNLKTTFHGLNEYKAFVDEQNLTAGDRLEVDVVVFENAAALLPFDTILNRDGKSYVLLIEKEHAVPQEVHIVQSAEQGIVTKEDLAGKKLVKAKPDILLRLLSGYRLKIEE